MISYIEYYIRFDCFIYIINKGLFNYIEFVNGMFIPLLLIK